MPAPAPPADPLVRGKEQLDRVTRGAKDEARGTTTLRMPLEVFVVSSFAMPQDDPRRCPPSAVPLWSPDELQLTLAAAARLMERCFGVKLECGPPRTIALAVPGEASLANFAIPDPQDFRTWPARLQRGFDAMIARAAPPLARGQWASATHALFIDRIYHAQRQNEVDHPERSSTVGFALAADSDDADERSNRVIVGYLPDRTRRREPADSRLVSWVPGHWADVKRAGAVLAHEIGHSLGLEHDEAAVGGRKNLMSATIDDPPPGQPEPAGPEDYGLTQEDAKTARANGLETKRLH